MADAGIALASTPRSRRFAPILPGLVFIAIVVGLWKLVVTVFAIPAFMMPPPENGLLVCPASPTSAAPSVTRLRRLLAPDTAPATTPRTRLAGKRARTKSSR